MLCLVDSYSPLSIAFFLYGHGAEIYEDYIKTLDIPNRLNVIAHFSDAPDPYPINKLRNIALRNVRTTHIWLADMDMWPACRVVDGPSNFQWTCTVLLSPSLATIFRGMMLPRSFQPLSLSSPKAPCAIVSRAVSTSEPH